MNHDWIERYWALDRKALFRIPEHWAVIRMDAWGELLRAKRMTVNRLIVFMEIAQAASLGENEVRITMDQLAKRSGISIATVFRAVRFLEEAGALFRQSGRNSDSRWQVNPWFLCKQFPKAEVVSHGIGR
jgi:DNA-binding MarR family transcriptional regulator